MFLVRSPHRCLRLQSFFVWAALFLPLPLQVAMSAERPNIVFIFADDMGWGTGQFNNPSSVVQTPNLNALAAAGLNFTRGYAATVCSPSRGMLMTGLHPGNGFNDRNSNIGAGLRDEDVTVAEVLQDASYTTGVFGKWGWGGSNGSGELRPNPTVNNSTTLPQNQGFDEFYGFLSHSRAHSYQVDSLWTTSEPAEDNNNGLDEIGEKYQPNSDNGLWLEKTGNNALDTHAAYTHDLIGLKSEAFVRDHANGAEPFYMQVNYTIPHLDLDEIVHTSPLVNLKGETIAPAGIGPYADMLDLFPKEQRHAAMVSRMDASIGSLIARLEDPDGDGDASDSVLANTLIVFASDNGPTPKDGLGVGGLDYLELAGGLRGGKRDLFEGGIRVPLLVRWDGGIEESRRGTTDSTLTDLADFMATAADLAGAQTPLGIDGVSIVPQIKDQVDARTKRRGYLVTEGFENSDTGETKQDWAILRGQEKLIRFSNGTYGLYNLAADPTESNPLDLGVAANTLLKEELEAIAIADGAGLADDYYARARSWIGADGASLQETVNWNDPTGQVPAWQATVENLTANRRVAVVEESVRYLGLEVRGDPAEQVVDIYPGRTLSGRNEVRVQGGGRVELAGGTLRSNRWIDIFAGGKVGGDGVLQGQVYNAGELAPGRADDLPKVPLGLSEPEPLKPVSLDTGLVNLVTFDFAGVQDNAPLTQTLQLDPNVMLQEGLNFGPGVSARHPGGGGSDAGDEFNVSGFTIGGSLSQALLNQDYLTFTLDPGAGAGILGEEVGINLWRNGSNAAQNYAIFTSEAGFEDPADAVNQFLNLTDEGIANPYFLTANLLAPSASPGPLEVRIYGWGAGTSNGNTHFNFVSLDGAVVAVPTLAFDFTGVQDDEPLTALSIAPAELNLTQGLHFGPGVEPKSNLAGPGTDAGEEFNVVGWSSGSSLGDAIAEEDYLTFSVQATAGLAVIMDSVSFQLWRNGPNAPTDYAILSSIDGFADGQQLLQQTVTDDGIAHSRQLLAQFDNAEPTQDEIEFRLYGWNASGEGNTHVNDVSLRARFQTIFDVDLDPTGRLEVDGDLFHLDGGVIALEIGGSDNSNPHDFAYDHLAVSGVVELEGDLRLSLVEDFMPSLGDVFDLLTASSVVGQFQNLVGAEVNEFLRFKLIYASDRVQAVVAPQLEGDFNADGVVDAADYTVWRDLLNSSVTPYTGGDADGNGWVDMVDYLLWKNAVGLSLPNHFGPLESEPGLPTAVPEPSTWMLVTSAGLALLPLRRI